MKLVFAADMSFNYMPGFPGVEKAAAGMTAPAALFAQADFSMVNLENIFGEPGDGAPIIKDGPNLLSSSEFMAYIRALKPTVVGLANNHSKDFGEGPMFATMDMLRAEGHTVIGAGHNLAEAYAPAILEKDGVKVAIIACCENEYGCATATDSGTAGYNITYVTHAIRDARAAGAKPIIYFHGGNEYNPFPSPGKVDLYRHFVDIGAEAVICMHTHCPQGYEMYDGKPIVYSMGNFFFPDAAGSNKASWYYGYMTEVNVTADGITLTPHPYTFDFDGIYPLEGEDKAHFMKYLEQLNAPIGDMAEIHAWYDCWCTRIKMCNRFSYFKPELFTDGYAQEIRVVKNALGCEAHNEVATRSLFMIYENVVEAAKERSPLIDKLQAMELI